MGTFGISAEEIRDEIEDCLNDMEGDFDSETLKEGLKLAQRLGDTYSSTTDRCLCECGHVFSLHKDKESEAAGAFSFQCPKCKHHN